MSRGSEDRGGLLKWQELSIFQTVYFSQQRVRLICPEIFLPAGIPIKIHDGILFPDRIPVKPSNPTMISASIHLAFH